MICLKRDGGNIKSSKRYIIMSQLSVQLDEAGYNKLDVRLFGGRCLGREADV